MEKSAIQPWMGWALATGIAAWGALIVLALITRQWWIAADLALVAALAWAETIAHGR